MSTTARPQPGRPIGVQHNMVTTTFTIEGYRVARSLGIVRGITVRSRSVLGTLGAGLQTLIGGNITLLTELCERSREEAFDLMLLHASQLGANAIVGARYDATEVMQGVTEVLAYGTAVMVAPVARVPKIQVRMFHCRKPPTGYAPAAVSVTRAPWIFPVDRSKPTWKTARCAASRMCSPSSTMPSLKAFRSRRYWNRNGAF